MKTLREIIAATVQDSNSQLALEQALLAEGYSLEPPIIEGAQHRLRGIATLHLESMPGIDGSVGVMDLKADLNVWMDPVIQEGRLVPPGGFGFSEPDIFLRYDIQAEGFTVPMSEDGKTHLTMRLRDEADS